MSPCVGVDATNEVPEMRDFSSSPFASLYASLPPTPEGRTLIISRHGESLYNLEDRIGGNPGLSPRGEQYAEKLAEHVNAIRLDSMKVKKQNFKFSRAKGRGDQMRQKIDVRFSRAYCYVCTWCPWPKSASIRSIHGRRKFYFGPAAGQSIPVVAPSLNYSGGKRVFPKTFSCISHLSCVVVIYAARVYTTIA